MIVAAVVCLCAAVATALSGVWSLTRPASADYVHSVLRGVAPTQLAAAVMLAAGSAVAFFAVPPTSIAVVGLCVVGAVGTVAAGCWQSAKAVARTNAAQAAGGSEGCAGACASCTLSCG
ncbi:hypothetical protein Mycch_5307 [Mycolicibacterium chubuense NBB4]|uniref:Transmembrane protein n=1 Tax=Mycolicibacterium chubuense (strain NBB4) TaxID=710421 RepID=I4BRT4_MYCCN|nr:hypothetical protein [Mycolicibacterium chubuense]AFM19991.1 hypothetical protein Mycch_5307 [Mycolicibacterium chubuense NBB4]